MALPLFILLVLGGGIGIGVVTAPGDWYAALVKPSFNPPNWVFGPVWTLLYIFIGVAGARVWVRDRRSPAMKIWWAQLALNFLWSPVFFGAHRIDLALAIILPMLGCILAFVLKAWQIDRVSALLFLPYACWVAFASVLNSALFVLN